MDRVNSHTKSYNIPRSFEAIITKLEIGWPVHKLIKPIETGRVAINSGMSIMNN